MARRVRDGAVVLAVCAGFQVAGESFPDAEGEPHPGLGLLPVTTAKVAVPRAVGEVVAEVDAAFDLPTLTGFENHGGRTTLADGARPLAKVSVGVGNGGGDGTEGAVAGRVLGTYLHGPVLARNPALADLLLSWALDGAALEPLDDSGAESLRAERLEAVRSRRFRRRRAA